MHPLRPSLSENLPSMPTVLRDIIFGYANDINDAVQFAEEECRQLPKQGPVSSSMEIDTEAKGNFTFTSEVVTMLDDTSEFDYKGIFEDIVRNINSQPAKFVWTIYAMTQVNRQILSIFQATIGKSFIESLKEAIKE